MPTPHDASSSFSSSSSAYCPLGFGLVAPQCTVMTSLAPADADQSWKVIVSTAVSFGLATFAIIGRLVSRWLCRKTLELNDYFVLIAYVPKLGIDIASILLIQYGIGRHVTALSLEDLTNYLKVLYVGSFLYGPTISFIKLSVLSLYWTAFPTRFVRRSAATLAAIVVAWGVAVFLVGLLVCLPIHKAWDPTVPGTCIDVSRYYYGLQIPNIVTDFAILFLPFKSVWNLHLPTKQKLWMCGVLCLALVTCVFDIIRLVVLVRLPNGGDFTWNQTQASVWTDLEPSMAMLVACLPIMRPLLHPRQYYRRRGESNNDENGYEDTYSEIRSGKSDRETNSRSMDIDDSYEIGQAR